MKEIDYLHFFIFWNFFITRTIGKSWKSWSTERGVYIVHMI